MTAPLMQTSQEPGKSPTPLDLALRKVGAGGDLPAFGRDVQELLAVTSDEDANVRRVVGVILRNVSLTARIIRRVNSAYFSRGGREILSVSRAVALLGWDAVRDIASSLMLLDHFSRTAPGAKELLLVSLLTANNARELAAAARYPGSEEAYLCGMFANLGELIVACHMPAAYQKVLAEMGRSGSGEREACLAALGFTYGDLGREVLRQWGVPAKLSGGMLTPSSARRPRCEEERLVLIASLSRALTAAVYRMEPKEGRAEMTKLVSRFADDLGIAREEVEAALDEGFEQARASFTSAEVPAENLRLVRQMKNAMGKVRGGPTSESDEGHGGTQAAGERPQPDALKLTNLAGELEAFIASGRQEPGDVVMMALEAFYRAGGFDQVYFALVTPDRRCLAARAAVGEGASVEKFFLDCADQAAGELLAGYDIFADDVGRSRPALRLLAGQLGVTCFGALPLVARGRPVGCFYFGRAAGTLALDTGHKLLLKRLRDRVTDFMAASGVHTTWVA